MSTFLNYEGTMDFIAATPYLALTLGVSGSCNAGRAAVFDQANPGWVYQPVAVPSGSLIPAGVFLQTATDGNAVAVLVWGYAKSLPVLPTTSVLKPGQGLGITGSGYWCASGSGTNAAGKVISGSAGYAFALINTMNNVN